MALGAWAIADTGDLTPKDCIDDNAAGSEDCALAMKGLNAPFSVAASADGKSVYVASFNSDAIAIFERTARGRLAPAGCIADNDTGPAGCDLSVDGLDGVRGVALSADGKSLYAVSQNDSAIARFVRDTTTGDMSSSQGCIESGGPDNCTALIASGMTGASSVAVSPDGKSVYVASGLSSAIVNFKRNTTNGALTAPTCVGDNDTGPPGCALLVDGLWFVESVTVSSDNKSVYAASFTDDAVVRFNRATDTGALTAQGCIDDNDTGPEPCALTADGLDGALSVAVSPDGKSVYVASIVDSAIVRLKRLVATGAITPKHCIDDLTGADDCLGSVHGLTGAAGVAVSPDDASVYVTAFNDDALVAFDRGINGGLAAAGCIDDNDSGLDTCAQTTDGLDAARGVTVTADNKNVYVTSQGDHAVVRFKREFP